jgi:hypothetical protein
VTASSTILPAGLTRRCLQPYPTAPFDTGDEQLPFEPPAADLVLCLDVLIHQRKRAGYLTILEKALHAAGKVALVSGYSSRDQDPGWNVFFYEPLVDSIRRICPTGQVERLGEYRGTDLIKVQMARQLG